MRRFAFIPVPIPEKINAELVANYLDYWKFERGDSVYINEVARLWKLINDVRKIGPAIVKDLFGYLLAGGDYGSALINFVLPQFEEIRENELNNFKKSLAELTGKLENLTENDKNLVEEFIDDYFQLGGQTIGS